MYTLYIDTHCNKIIIVVYQNEKILVKKEIVSNYDHSITTMPILIEAINEVNLEIKDINQIIIVNGPGSFTGVRIGVTIAKTLAYTLNIPIKVLSSLLIKAISFSHDEVVIVEREKNGVFTGIFDKDNKLIEEYKYLSNSEYEKIEDKTNYYEDIEIDYEKIINFVNNIDAINPHAVNPLYVKKIEVQK